MIEEIKEELTSKDDGLCDYCHINKRVYYPDNKGNLSRRLGMCNYCKTLREKREQDRLKRAKYESQRLENFINTKHPTYGIGIGRR